MIGEIIQTTAYQKIVGSDHVMLKYNGVGISKDRLLLLQEKGIQIIRIVKINRNKPTEIYFSTVKQYLNSILTHKNRLLKNDNQKFVSFEDMVVA